MSLFKGSLPRLPDDLVLPRRLPSRRERIKRSGAGSAAQKPFVKIKFSDFRQTTVESATSVPTLGHFENLIDTAWQRGRRPVRLLGLGVRLGEADGVEQLSLFSESDSNI